MDKFGNTITTEIGRFSLQSSPRKSKDGELKKQNSSGGTGEPMQKPDKKLRHKISFHDDISNDKSKLTEIHLIESYKKFN